jgi:hypothetical protein
MNWVKQGRIFVAGNQNELMVSGGRTPTPLHLHDDVFRIYYACYDATMRGNIFSMDIDLKEPLNIITMNYSPLIRHGKVGFYDDNGIIPSCILEHEGKIYLYTIGFSLKNKVIFDASSGLALSTDKGNSFTKISGPVLDRTIDDPCFAASPSVLFEDGVFKMWYVSCMEWQIQADGSYKHFYIIKYKESSDGLRWNSEAKVSIDFKNEYEYAISRPTVIKHEGIYKMWYSFRAQKDIATYRMGYAESMDGIDWTRKDELMKHFDVSTDGWDSEMICYPYVFEHKGDLYMLYNGNGYGKSGFGLAILK